MLVSHITVNDVLFFAMQIALVLSVGVSVYERRAKAKIHSGIAKIKTKVSRWGQKVRSWVKVKQAQLMNKFRRKTGNQKLIIAADSVMSMSTTGNARISVNRGEGSWEYFGLAWTVLSVFIIEANSLYSSPLVNNYSIAILIADLIAITYLCFISSWFRNKIIWIVNLRNKTPDS